MSEQLPQSFLDNMANCNWRFGWHLLSDVINAFGCRVGVEIGVAAGGHANTILETTKVERLYGVDPYRSRESYDDLMNLPQSDFDELHRCACLFLSPHGERFRMIRKASTDAASLITEPLDFVYIDAEHTYEAAKSDLALWYPKVKAGGIFSGHDYNSGAFPGVGKAVDEFSIAHGLTINTGPHFFWWAISKGVNA